jgi:2-oxo-4-hydroxy-4-carboxy-5-ureidoimidazoline decarboxylase
MQLEDLNALDTPTAERELRRCCGSTQWLREMVAARPFETAEAMTQASDAIWSSLARADWLEAFAAHPRIGDRSASSWAATEQAGAANAADEVRNRLAAKNRDYEARFGYIFIVCATGQTAEAMLAMLEQRLTNGPDEELRIAAEEQRKITQLRLAKLLAAPQAAQGWSTAPSAEGREVAGGGGGAPPQSKK